MISRRWGLDLLRAVAILVVIEQHGRFISTWLGNRLQILGVPDGVDLFFVLSGFLIGGILLKDYSKTNELNVKSFWIRRWLRTLPIYFVALFINIIFMQYIFRYDFSKRDILYHFVFLQNMLPPYNDFRFFSEAWSLSIEEFFYLRLPIIIVTVSYITNKKDIKLVFIISLLVLVAISLSLRVFEYLRLPIENHNLTELNNRFRIIVPERLDSLAIGVLAAFARINFKSIWTHKNVIWVLFTLGLVWMIALDRTRIYSGNIALGFFTFVFYFLVYSVCVAFTLPFLDSWQPKENIFTKCITQISKQSYSMYLFHNSIIAIPFTKYASTLTHEHLRVALYLLYWILVFTISYFTYTLIEKPILNYRDRRYLQYNESKIDYKNKIV